MRIEPEHMKTNSNPPTTHKKNQKRKKRKKKRKPNKIFWDECRKKNTQRTHSQKGKELQRKNDFCFITYCFEIQVLFVLVLFRFVCYTVNCSNRAMCYICTIRLLRLLHVPCSFEQWTDSEWHFDNNFFIFLFLFFLSSIRLIVSFFAYKYRAWFHTKWLSIQP